MRAVGSGSETEYRFGSTATIIGKFLWIIGGPIIDRKISRLDLEQQVWSAVQFPELPTYNLLLHTATLFSDGILIMGVRRIFAFTPRNTESPELHVFDPIVNEIRVMPTYGQRPGFKKSHTMDFVEDRGIMVLFGGLPKAKSKDAQLFFLDVTSWRWTRPQTKGDSPTRRSRQASSVVGSLLFIYGGDSESTKLFFLDLASKNLAWSSVPLPALEPFGRVGPVMCALGRNRLIIYGGYTAGSNSSDLCVIENARSDKRTFHLVDNGVPASPQAEYSVIGDLPPGRECPRAMLYQDRMLVIAGNSRDKSDYFFLHPG